MSKYFYRIFTIIDLHFGAMQPCSSGLRMTLEASDFRSVRKLVAYSSCFKSFSTILSRYSCVGLAIPDLWNAFALRLQGKFCTRPSVSS